MRIGIKVGSSLLVDPAGGLNLKMVLKICQQIAELVTSGNQVFLVTSGAVASDPKKYRAKNLRAAVGMARLIGKYTEYLSIFKIETAQMLFTDNDLRADCRQRLIQLLIKAMEEAIVPIINANDTVDWQELNQLEKCADNDLLFADLCLALRPDFAIIGFDKPAFCDQNKMWVNVVSEKNWQDIFSACQSGNEFGHGTFGMATKMKAAKSLAQAGIRTLIAPGRENDFILRAIDELEENRYVFGTHFNFRQLDLPLAE